MAESMHVGIALELHYEYARAAMRGIVAYARPSRPWIFHLLDASPQKFPGTRVDHLNGVIGTLVYSEVTDVLHAQGVATINISNRHANPGVTRVGTDDRGIGQIAARHFLDRGFSHFAFIDTLGMHLSRERELGFADELAKAKLSYNSMSRWAADNNLQVFDTFDAIRQWMMTLPRPLALFAASDSVAWPVLEVCRDLDIPIPESIAVLAVDNDPMVCLLSSPTLSSVAVPAERIGYEAAALLDRILNGEEPPRDPVLIPAKEIVTRQSSDVLAIPDSELAAAVRFIRHNAGNRIGVLDVVRATQVARRSLERKFRTVLGRSPLEEIRRARLDRVRELLVNTDLSMPVIAERSGFDSAVRLTTVFREETGLTPTGFRRQFRIVEPITISEELKEEILRQRSKDGEAEREADLAEGPA
ncbi:MAG TPA: substrate-binding domain-containing protein [Phycisphaerae bacterium]|nr:substrate-binding domain-containing protein [Phycisphaerae bacterium]